MPPEFQSERHDVYDAGQAHHVGNTLRRRRRRAIAGAVAAVLLGLVALGLWVGAPSRPPNVSLEGQPSGDPTSVHGAARPPMRAVASLGLAVLVVDGSHVTVHLPDGAGYRLPLVTDAPGQVPVVPDDAGGVSWQPRGDAEGSPPILHTDRDGTTTTVIEARVAEAYTLVGGDHDTLYVTHRSGTTTVDLLVVNHRSGDRVIAEQDIAGTGEAIGSAVYADHSVYTVTAGATSRVVVDPFDGEPRTVFAGGGPAGERALSVGVSGNGRAYALIDAGETSGRPTRLLVIDQFQLLVEDEIAVPLTLGVEHTDPQATSVSVEGATILVNRRAGDGAFLPPLVYEIGAASWAVLSIDGGRAFLAQPAPEPAAEPGCAQDPDRINAEPTRGAVLNLYLICPHSAEHSDDVFRFDSRIERTGDVAADARAILQRLFEPLPTALADRGYTALSRETGTGTIRIRDVTFADGTLVVDFDFPETGVGSYSTSHGSLVWHRLVLANLLQLDPVEEVELRQDGTCDYGSYFEGSGCRRAGPADALWNDGR